MGKYETSKKRNPLIVPVVILSIVVVVLLGVVGCLLCEVPQESREEEGTSEPAGSTAPMEETQAEETETAARVTDVELYFEEDVCIPTAYVVLHMPEHWSDCLRVEQTQNGSAYSYTFYGQVTGKPDMGLFTIHFNEDGEMALGRLETGEAGEVYVNLSPMELQFDESWAGDEIDLICAMQESTNYLMDQLALESAFSRD